MKTYEIWKCDKKLIRIICKVDFLAHTDPLFKKTNILKLEDIKAHEMCKFIHDDINFGHNFNFPLRSSIHDRSTRNQSLFALLNLGQIFY